MRHGRSLQTLLATLVVSLLAVVGAEAGKPLTGIPLVWKPTELKDTGVVNLSGITDVKIQIEPLVDSRPDKARIGENQEDKVPKPVTTSDSVADFTTRHLGEALRRTGFSIVEQGGDFTLGGGGARTHGQRDEHLQRGGPAQDVPRSCTRSGTWPRTKASMTPWPPGRR